MCEQDGFSSKHSLECTEQLQCGAQARLLREVGTRVRGQVGRIHVQQTR